MAIRVSTVTSHGPGRAHRSGAVAIFAAFTMAIMIACLAFAVDLGYLNVVRTELQRTADAAAMAAAWELVDQGQLLGNTLDLTEELLAARNTATEYAALNQVAGSSPTLDLNLANVLDGDIVVGFLANPSNLDEPLSVLVDPNTFNTVWVRVRRTEARNGPISLFFARALGINTVPVIAEAAATFSKDRVIGFRVTPQTSNADLLPFALDITDWNDLLASLGTDNWTYDPSTGTVTSGSDGIPETKLFPNKSMGLGITPGNFGTVDIGATDNSSATLMRQISKGVSAKDLAYHGGELVLDPITGTLTLDGDTGVDSNLELALQEVVGAPKSIMLYSTVENPGDTASFTIVGFAGIRVVDFNLQGGKKHITIQPAMVVDDAAVTDPNMLIGNYVYQPVRLTR